MMAALTKQKEVAPSNIDAERAILGRILVGGEDVWYELQDRLSAADFFEDKHQAIYRGMVSLAEAQKPITRELLLSQVDVVRGEVGISAYLAGLMASDKAHKVEPLVEAVLHASGCRRIVAGVERIKQRALSAALDTPIEGIRAEASSLLEEAEGARRETSRSLSQLLTVVMNNVNDVKAGRKPAGIKTGLKNLDDLMGPMLTGQLIVIGGETGSGKTALAWEVGILVAQQGFPVQAFSQEMTGEELAARHMAACCAGMSSEKIIEGQLSDAEAKTLYDAIRTQAEVPIYVDDTPNVSVSIIEARLARAIKKLGVRLAIIDHLQFVKPHAGQKEHEQLRHTVDAIKAMAKRLGIPVILISHVSRKSDLFEFIRTAADVRRPTLSQLYGSSAIEKAADKVVFVHRPSWFLERASGGGAKDKDGRAAALLRWQGKAEFVLPKRRGGLGFAVREVFFDEERTWFRNMDYQPDAMGM